MQAASIREQQRIQREESTKDNQTLRNSRTDKRLAVEVVFKLTKLGAIDDSYF
jgi:hypothetical protein